jgi:hypothetical protein
MENFLLHAVVVQSYCWMMTDNGRQVEWKVERELNVEEGEQQERNKNEMLSKLRYNLK